MKSSTILIVDDIPSNLSLLREELRANGYKVIVAESGMSALRRIEHITPDIILLDVMMPGIDGFETSRRLKLNAATCDTPIIFLTALTDSIDKVRSFDAGGVDYVCKPIDIAEVLARIRTHLTIVSLQKQLKEQNDQLEAQVQARSAHILLLNHELQLELDRRRHSEQEKDKLLSLVQGQLEQTRTLSTHLVEVDEKQRAELVTAYNETIVPRLESLRTQIEQIHESARVPKVDGSAVEQLAEAGLIELRQIEDWLNQITLEAGAKSSFSAESARLSTLSKREVEVLSMITDGVTTHQIGEVLHVSENTVRTYKTRVMRKLQIDTLPDLVKFALRHDLTQ